VDLGFLERDYQAWELDSGQFPSKVGGRPAWLDLTKLPSPADLQCPHCKAPLCLLLQCYAPDPATPAAFHRTLLLFLCRQSACWAEHATDPPILALRSQLYRDNPCYPALPPGPGPAPALAAPPLCAVCGGRGDLRCSRCRGPSYCCPACQRLDWRAGHKADCRPGAPYTGSKAGWTLQECLLDMEVEPDEDEEDGGVDLCQSEEGAGLQLGEVGEAEWEELERGQAEDRTCEKFRQRIRRAPDQVLRYERRGKPLLCAARPALPAPPPCPLCSAPRTFELQVMPQLLCELGLGLEAGAGLDWGSLYLFTCDASCSAPGYTKEVLYLRQFELSNLPGT